MADCNDPRIGKVVEYVTRDLSRRVSRAEAATLAFLEPRYFSKRFRKAVGISFVAWSVQCRVQRAQHLLLRSGLPIREIAAAVGYEDLSAFERVFRKHTLCCPSVYRAKGRAVVSSD